MLSDNTPIIGIIGAMQSEVDLLAAVTDEKTVVRLGKHTYITGKIGAHPVVITNCGDGKVNSAACATAMILHFSAGIIINTGVCGALDPALGVGDVVVADAAVEYDLDYNVLGHARGTVLFPDGTTEIILPTDRELADALAAAAQSLGIAPLRCTVASGDRFVSDPSVKRQIREWFGDGVGICEMEGASVSHVCRLFGVRCGILRSVSDSADGNAEVDFPTFVKSSARIAAGVVEKLIRDL